MPKKIGVAVIRKNIGGMPLVKMARNTILEMISGPEAEKPDKIECLANQAKHKSRKKH